MPFLLRAVLAPATDEAALLDSGAVETIVTAGHSCGGQVIFIPYDEKKLAGRLVGRVASFEARPLTATATRGYRRARREVVEQGQPALRRGPRASGDDRPT